MNNVKDFTTLDAATSRVTIMRLTRYLRVLQKLKAVGIVNVFSNNLGDALAVTPAIVRKDFSLLGITGNKRGGYNIDTLIGELRRLLGKESTQKVVLVGCGRIGSALLEYKEFAKDGMEIVAAFDSDPNKVNPEGRIPILPMERLSGFAAEQEIQVGIITVPEASALSVFEQMIQAGISGFLNFTPVELKCAGRCQFEQCPYKCTVQNVNISLELESLFYLVHLKRTDPAP
ncbi:MAG TPA: redox-sensing transcriptional repressor Rex [Spirochaetia bacterium]|nr:redox-sensing transcriptional repressor Rex [Spirochaetia bacterium]